MSYDGLMTNSTNTATIEFTIGAIDSVVDQLSAFLDAEGFPVITANLETGLVTVNSASDHNDYSVLMAATSAAQAVELDTDDVIAAELS